MWRWVQQKWGVPESLWALPALGKGAVLWEGEVGVVLLPG